MNRPQKSTLPCDLADTTFRLVVACHQVQERLAAHADLSIPEFRTLRLFRTSAPLQIKELTESLGLSGSRLSRILDSLEKRSLVVRSIDPVDRRNILVSLTPAGESLAERLREGCGEAHEKALERIPPELHAEMLDIMKRFLAAMELSLRESKASTVALQPEGMER